VLELLKSWGIEGLQKHCDSVSKFYKLKSEIFLKYATKHLANHADFYAPTAGKPFKSG
jgi:DNA-binding transcriptional MocR family regulator